MYSSWQALTQHSVGVCRVRMCECAYVELKRFVEMQKSYDSLTVYALAGQTFLLPAFAVAAKARVRDMDRIFATQQPS